PGVADPRRAPALIGHRVNRAVLRGSQDVLERNKNELPASQADQTPARKRVQGSGRGLSRGPDQTGQFALREWDGYLLPILHTEYVGQFGQVVQNPILDILKTEQLDLLFQVPLARDQ